ncbi:MAG TPA: hypothetical protein VIS48_09425 [Candidatus Kryptonia bacterium]
MIRLNDVEVDSITDIDSLKKNTITDPLNLHTWSVGRVIFWTSGEMGEINFKSSGDRI